MRKGRGQLYQQKEGTPVGTENIATLIPNNVFTFQSSRCHNRFLVIFANSCLGHTLLP